MTRLHRFVCLGLLLIPISLLGDVGVLMPGDSDEPDPAILSLDSMNVDIHIDDGDARVAIRQIFASHVPEILEGQYLFGLPTRATVSDFAVWDGVTRIPGVIVERRRAEEIYDSLKQQQIDPGLLQQGEAGSDETEASRSSAFSARIVPIPGHGTKRLEMEYHEVVPVENLRSQFALPLKPTAYNIQTVGTMNVNVSVASVHALRDFRAGQTYPLRIAQQDAHVVSGTFSGTNIRLTDDFTIEWALDPSAADTLQVETYRNPRPGLQNPTDAAPRPSSAEPGFFRASALLATAPAATTQTAPRTVIAAFDASLSMQWDKLERSFRALETLLHALRPTDRFNVVVFNRDAASFQPAPVAATSATIEQALAFVRASRLRGGTDMTRALTLALDQSALGPGDRYVVLLSDGNGTTGSIANAQLAATYTRRREQFATAERPRMYVLGVGDDVNVSLLRMLTRDDGLLETLHSTEAADFKVDAFIAKLGARPLDRLALTVDPPASVDMVYPLDPVVFAGSSASWVGRYPQPAPGRVSFTARGARDNRPLEMKTDSALPSEALEHEGLPRLWAKARVDALLDKIARDGEDTASIDEVIRLAREYKFVTPYTSFLAAPRALLRPRVIKPGDPVLRVATDESIVSVVAMFPFGLVKPLRYLPDEHVWQTRFLAPADMNDGTYAVRLVMRDASGNAYREAKTFVIASKPPVLRVSLDKASGRAGDRIQLRASASASTRTIVARLYGATPADLRWDAVAGASLGTLVVPDDLSAGRYSIRVTAEDMAHNISSQELTFDVLP